MEKQYNYTVIIPHYKIIDLLGRALASIPDREDIQILVVDDNSGIDENEWLNRHNYYKHIGIYAYRSRVLSRLIQLEQSELEISESLEQLRWIENGFSIKVEETLIENIAIDTPEDLLKIEKI